MSRLAILISLTLLLGGFSPFDAAEGAGRKDRLKATKAKKERLVEEREKRVIILGVGEGYINLNERRFYLNSDTAIYNKKNKKISLSTLKRGMKVDIEYRFDEKYRPILISIKLVSGH